MAMNVQYGSGFGVTSPPVSSDRPSSMGYSTRDTSLDQQAIDLQRLQTTADIRGANRDRSLQNRQFQSQLAAEQAAKAREAAIQREQIQSQVEESLRREAIERARLAQERAIEQERIRLQQQELAQQLQLPFYQSYADAYSDALKRQQMFQYLSRFFPFLFGGIQNQGAPQQFYW